MKGRGMKITLADLDEAGACQSQRREFDRLFPEGVEVTPDLCEKYSDVFDWSWAAENLLSPSAWAEYEKVTASALAEYEKVTEPAWAEFDKVTASAWAEFDKVTASAWAEYEKVRASALAEYGKVDARAFGALFAGKP